MRKYLWVLQRGPGRNVGRINRYHAVRTEAAFMCNAKVDTSRVVDATDEPVARERCSICLRIIKVEGRHVPLPGMYTDSRRRRKPYKLRRKNAS